MTVSNKIVNMYMQLIYEKTGICIEERKDVFLEIRLKERLHNLGIDSYADYFDLISDESSEELDYFLDCITTHKTNFNREVSHLNHIAKICETKHHNTDTDFFSIWCAACSTGQEVYSVAIILENLKKKVKNFNYKIFGTDISGRCIEQSNNGIYSLNECKDLSISDKEDYFFITRNHIGEKCFQVKEFIKKNIHFKKYNLLEDKMSFEDDYFHFIIMKNVIIYMNKISSMKILRIVEKKIKTDGILYIGYSESLPDGHSFKQIKNNIFMKKNSA